ncbi:MAG TPA: nucleoside hydrolase [Rudaea sp.]|nr:nucleoside hydrolase [Rudaea sp.]
MAKLHLLIDTDPGVDDALAIMLAHAHANVCGLTVAAGNVGIAHTVGNALKLVEILDADTPVFAGCATPLVVPAPDAAFVHGNDGFGDTGYLPSSRRVHAESAALAILRLSHEYAGTLVIVAMAPLTNLALALRLDPSLPQRVAKLVIMGGAVTGRGNIHRVPAEFNIGFDPEAAHIVFSEWPHFILVDWELVLRNGIGFDAMQSWLAADTPLARFYAAISQRTRDWMQAHGRPRLLTADAVAMAVALQPDIVERYEDHHVGVELQGHLTRGATVVDWEDRLENPANARIVLDIDHSRFEALVVGVLGGQ